MREAVIVSTARTPIGKAYRGAFNNTEAPTLGGHAVKHAVERAGIDPAEVDDEQHHLHFGIVEGQSTLVACVVAVPLGPTQAKIRQMVVDEPYQRQGIGASLLRKTEAELGQRGFQSIELNARDLATGFYEKLGYRVEGEPFIEVKIQHFKMSKWLSPLDLTETHPRNAP